MSVKKGVDYIELRRHALLYQAWMQQQAQQQAQQQQINNMYAWRSMQGMFGTLPPQGTGPSSPSTKVREFSGRTKGAEAVKHMLASARRRLAGR